MPVNYIVQAEVVDIRSDAPKNEDIFLVDTNAWYWYTYTVESSLLLWLIVILQLLTKRFRHLIYQ